MLSRRARAWQPALGPPQTHHPEERGGASRLEGRGGDKKFSHPSRPRPSCLSSRCKERLEHRRRLALTQPPVDLGRVVAGWVLEEARAVVDRAALGGRGGGIEA